MTRTETSRQLSLAQARFYRALRRESEFGIPADKARADLRAARAQRDITYRNTR